MKNVNIVRAWRDAEYRSSLDADVRNNLPANPAGIADIDDNALKSITGGCGNTACSCGPGGPTTILFSCTPPGTYCP